MMKVVTNSMIFITIETDPVLWKPVVSVTNKNQHELGQTFSCLQSPFRDISGIQGLVFI